MRAFEPHVKDAVDTAVDNDIEEHKIEEMTAGDYKKSQDPIETITHRQEK